MRKQHSDRWIGYRYPTLILRMIPLLVSTPFLVTFFDVFRGRTVHEAMMHAKMVMASSGSLAQYWAYIFVTMLIILTYLHPLTRMYCACSSGNPPTQADANKVIGRFNHLHVFILALSIAGFLLGDMQALIYYGKTDSVTLHLAFMTALSKGLLCGIIISFNLENLLFRAKKNALELSPRRRLRKTSLYRKIALVVATLIFFLMFQLFSLANESFIQTDNVGNRIVSERAIMEYFAEEKIKGPGQAVSVIDIKLIMYLFFAGQLLYQIKRMIRDPLKSMKDRLEILNSGEPSEITTIDVLNNDEFSGVLGEINTLIQKQQSELECSSKRLEKIFTHAADPIITFTASGKILAFNPAAERFFGYAEDEATAVSLLNLIELPAMVEGECAACETNETLIRLLYAKESGISRFTGIRKDGARVQFESNVSQDRSGDAVIYTAILRDIAQQMRIEEALSDAKTAAENANRLKTEFLANMSHELRTPLNAVLGFTQLLGSDKNLTPGQLEKIAIISRSGEHLLSLINDILDISKIEAGKSELHLSVFSPGRFIEDIREMFELRCKKNGLGLYVEYSGPLPQRVKGDLGKLRQVMINLVGNAVKFTSEGGIGILAGMDGTKMRFSVTDSGKGIPADELELIMQPFIQSSVTDNEGGTGLGLAISSRYIQMMGGELSVQSELGKGSTFSFAIDLPETDEEAPESSGDPVAVALKKGCEVTALVVDDKELNRLVLKEMLETAGFTAIEAENGKVSVERAKEFKPDIIFMDIKMPVMDGYQAVKILKEDPETRDIPVFALTASAFTNDEEKILDSGFDGFLAKPFKRSDLFRLIRDKSKVELEYEESAPQGEKRMPDESAVDYGRVRETLGKEGIAELSECVLINDFTAVRNIAARISQTLPDFAALIGYHADSFDESALEAILRSLTESVQEGQRHGN